MYTRKRDELFFKIRSFHTKIQLLLSNYKKLRKEILEQNTIEVDDRGDPIKDQLDDLHTRVEEAELYRADLEEMRSALEDVWSDLIKLTLSFGDTQVFLDKYGLEFYCIVIEVCRLYSDTATKGNWAIYNDIQNFYDSFNGKLQTLGSGVAYKAYPNPCNKGEYVLIDITDQDVRKRELSAGDLLSQFIPLLGSNLTQIPDFLLKEISQLNVQEIINNFSVTNYLSTGPIDIQDNISLTIYNYLGQKIYTANEAIVHENGQQSIGIDLSSDITSNFTSGINIVKIDGYNYPFIIIAH